MIFQTVCLQAISYVCEATKINLCFREKTLGLPNARERICANFFLYLHCQGTHQQKDCGKIENHKLPPLNVQQRQRSLFCFHPNNPVRRLCIWITGIVLS